MTERTPFNYPEFFRDVARIAVPVALQHLLTTTGSMIDTVMLGRLGENTVGAVGLHELCVQLHPDLRRIRGSQTGRRRRRLGHRDCTGAQSCHHHSLWNLR